LKVRFRDWLTGRTMVHLVDFLIRWRGRKGPESVYLRPSRRRARMPAERRFRPLGMAWLMQALKPKG
jgi:hypothetical protein